MYKYEDERSWVMGDEGQRALLKARDRAHALLARSGAATCRALVSAFGAGDSFHHLAIIDRLVEVGELRIACMATPSAQDWVYVPGPEAPGRTS